MGWRRGGMEKRGGGWGDGGHWPTDSNANVRGGGDGRRKAAAAEAAAAAADGDGRKTSLLTATIICTEASIRLFSFTGPASIHDGIDIARRCCRHRGGRGRGFKRSSSGRPTREQEQAISQRETCVWSGAAGGVGALKGVCRLCDWLLGRRECANSSMASLSLFHPALSSMGHRRHQPLGHCQDQPRGQYQAIHD